MISSQSSQLGADSDRPEPKPSIKALQLYGPGGWRAKNPHLYASDASLRWVVDQHRERLTKAGALGMFAGRLTALLPQFDEAMVDIARESLTFRQRDRQLAFDTATARTNTTEISE